jgi:Domain of unknown function (DUF4375)
MMISVDQAYEIAEVACKRLDYDRSLLPPTLQVVHLINWLNFEVHLGGVMGWIVNMGDYGPATVKALETVGAHQCSSIVRQMLDFFPGGQPASGDQERVRQIMAIEDVAEPRWSELGDRLLAWPDDIHALLQRFINEHEADFT